MSARSAEKMMEWIIDSALPQNTSILGYSEYCVSAKRREYGGVTFREYISERRLINTADSMIADIALDCGLFTAEFFPAGQMNKKK